MNVQNGRRTMCRYLIGFMIAMTCFILPISCASTPDVADTNVASTYCMVYDYDSRPVSGVEISIEGSIRAKTDINGRSMLMGLEPGNYKILFRKQDYELVQGDFNIGDLSQVLYIKMISRSQLLKEAENELNQRHWREARSYIQRSLALVPSDPATRYLDATLHFRQDDIVGAEEVLFSLLKDDYREPYVLLFLADIEQYKLKNLVKAKVQLVDYLKLRYDPDIEQRLQNLIRDLEALKSDNASTHINEEVVIR